MCVTLRDCGTGPVSTNAAAASLPSAESAFRRVSATGPELVLPLPGDLRPAPRTTSPGCAELVSWLDELARPAAHVEPEAAFGRCRQLGWVTGMLHRLARGSSPPSIAESDRALIERLGVVRGASSLPIAHYFDVRHVPSDRTSLGATVLQVARDVLQAVVPERCTLDDLVALADSFALSLHDCYEFAAISGEGSRATPEHRRTARGGDPVSRAQLLWRVGHHAYLLFNRMAAWQLEAAAAATRAGRLDDVIAPVRVSARYVRGMSAAMVFACPESSSRYRAWVRPTMQPPCAESELAGGQLCDRAEFRSALARFLDACHEPFHALVRSHRELAMARDELLQADLREAERHVGIADRYIGASAPALDMHLGSAVAELRRATADRISTYGHLLRHEASMAKRCG